MVETISYVKAPNTISGMWHMLSWCDASRSHNRALRKNLLNASMHSARELIQDIKAHLQRRRTCYSSAKNTLHFCFSITQGCSNTNKATGWEPPQVCNCLSLVTWSCPWPLWAHYSYWEKDRLDYLNFRAYIQAHSSITVTLRTEVE